MSLARQVKRHNGSDKAIVFLDMTRTIRFMFGMLDEDQINRVDTELGIRSLMHYKMLRVLRTQRNQTD